MYRLTIYPINEGKRNRGSQFPKSFKGITKQEINQILATSGPLKKFEVRVMNGKSKNRQGKGHRKNK